MPVVGAIFTDKPYSTLEDVKNGLTFNDRFDQLFSSDYAVAHSLLVACSSSNADAPVKTFDTAVNMLNNGNSAVEIYKVLAAVKRFKQFLPATPPTSEFAIPSTVFLDTPQKLLGKRTNSSCSKGQSRITSFLCAPRS